MCRWPGAGWPLSFLCTFDEVFQVPGVKTLTHRRIPKLLVVLGADLVVPERTRLAVVAEHLCPVQLLCRFDKYQPLAATVITDNVRKRCLVIGQERCL